MGYLSSLMGRSWEMKCVDQSCVGRSWEMKCVDQSCVGRSDKMKWREGGSEKWGWSAREMSGSDCFHKWIGVRNGKRKLTVHRVRVREVRRLRIGTKKWVDRSLDLLRSVCGSFSSSSVCGSELVKLCVRVRELRWSFTRVGALKWHKSAKGNLHRRFFVCNYPKW